MLRLILLILFSNFLLAQLNLQNPIWFKGDHFVAYNKCRKAVIFCENTQQDYTFCGAFINCQGLYVNPGDTFYINYEDKWQSKKIVADVLFQGYLPVISGHTFEPVFNCIPPAAIQINIPLTAIPGSSFQITVQNATYDPPETNVPNIPYPFLIYVGGQPAPNTISLADYASCDISQQEDTSAVGVSVKELSPLTLNIYPNPTRDVLHLYDAVNDLHTASVLISGLPGNLILSMPFKPEIDLSSLSAGIYFITISIPNGLSINRKIIKE